jgi:pimeloyl-ACP methyl ester carboxylesterase
MLRSKRNNRDPVIFVPGFLSSQLEISNVDWNKFSKCNFSERNDGTIWISLDPPPGGTCQLELLKCGYDNNGNFNSSPYSKIEVKGKFGDIESSRCLNDTAFCFAGQFGVGKDLFDGLISVGYENGKDLFGAAYDFRLVPYGNAFNINSYNQTHNYVGRYFLQLKNLIEDVYRNNGNKKVHLVGHSEGCKIISLFISVFRKFSEVGDIESGWVDKYLNKLMLVAPAIEGAPKILQGILSGTNPGLPLATDKETAKLARTFAGSMFLIPPFKESYDNTHPVYKGIFASLPDETYLIGSKNEVGYNSNMLRFLTKCSETNEEFNLVIDLYLNILNANIEAFNDPGLEVQLYLGDICNTPKSFKYSNYNFDNLKITWSDKGDSTVPSPYVILNGTEYMYNGEIRKIYPWKNVHINKYICNTPTNETMHLDLIKNKDVINSIIDIVSR